MQMFAAIVDPAGAVQARSEGEVSVEGDLTVIIEDAMYEFRQARPDTLLLEEIGRSGYEIRIGRA